MAKEKVYLFDHSPHLRDEWDYSENKGIDPLYLSRGMHKRVNWVCEKKHTWVADIASRTRGNGCPYCSGWSVEYGGETCLQTRFPSVALELNDDSVDPKAIAATTKLMVEWKCSNGHTWSCTVKDRTASGVIRGCPYCSGNRLLSENSLLSTNPALCGEAVDKTIDFGTVFSRTRQSVEWECSLGHTWSAPIYNRNIRGFGCPYCSGKRVSTANSLKTLAPDLSKELVGIDPATVHAASSKKVWWVCPEEGHTWEATIKNRYHNQSGCPTCANRATSRIENTLRGLCSQFLEVNGEPPFDTGEVWTGTKRSLSVDILGSLSEHVIAIEYDGCYYHQNQYALERDERKTLIMLEAGILVIRIREQSKQYSLPNLEISHGNLLQIHAVYSQDDLILTEAVEKIKQWLDQKTTKEHTND